MFQKLLKYEFKSLGKWYFSLYAIVVLLSVVLGFWIQTIAHRNTRYFENGPSNTEEWLFGITIFAFALLIVSLFVSTFFMVLSRFYRNIYGRQGYLTMTLPITSHQLIFSKLVAALIWYFLAGLVLFLSSLVIAGLAYSQELPSMSHLLKGLLTGFSELIGQHFVQVILFVLDVLVESIMGILLGYFAISLGQLFREHRILLAIAFYVGLHFVMGIFQTIVSFSVLYNATDATLIFSGNPLMIGANILFGIGFYFGTHYIMTRKLNLQ